MFFQWSVYDLFYFFVLKKPIENIRDFNNFRCIDIIYYKSRENQNIYYSKPSGYCYSNIMVSIVKLAIIILFIYYSSTVLKIIDGNYITI